MNRGAVEVFFSYAHEDEGLMNDVRRQLYPFEREGRIIKWHDRQIPAGANWEATIDERLRNADLVLLFVSPAFLESRYCYDVELGVALERHNAGLAQIIPIILRPCAWENAPFATLQALPRDARPVTQWADRDQVCLDIARGVIEVADRIAATGSPRAAVPPPGGTASPIRERRLFEGDRIGRIVVPFTPPRGINIPPGYQRRLNYIAAETARDSAVRGLDGGFEYPAQFRGPHSEVRAFAERLAEAGSVTKLGIDESGPVAEIWFEYAGGMAPHELRDLAAAANLEVVHCGAWLIGKPNLEGGTLV